jgi:Protein kinase domain
VARWILVSEDHSGQLAGFRPGTLLAGRYRLEAQVGAGGMAVVFRARDERLDRPVAVKILDPARASDPSFRRRFIAESRAAAKVEDPHIIPVYDAAEADGMLFIAMQYVAGGDLRALLQREGAMPPERAMAFISPVASALDAAHRAGLVHRDVKPANVLVDIRPGWSEHVYLSDFGIAKAEVSTMTLTEPGGVLGTPDYVAPEQIDGKAVDGRTDQYSLACVAYRLLTGAPPYERDSGMAVMVAHLYAPPPSLRAKRPDLPGDADKVLAKALAKAPDQRYASCGEFAAALADSLGVASYRPGRPGRTEFGSGPQALQYADTVADLPQIPAQDPVSAGTPAPAPVRRGARRPAGTQRQRRQARRRLGARAMAAAIAIPVLIAVAVIALALANTGGKTGAAQSAAFTGYPGQQGGVTINSVASDGTTSGGGLRVAVGSADGHPAIWRSSGASGTWTQVPAASAAVYAMRGAMLMSVAHGPQGWLAVGWDAGGARVCGATPQPVAVTSANGLNWHRLGSVGPFTGQGFCASAVAVGPDGYVVVGTQTRGVARFAALWSSADLKTWHKDNNGGFDGTKSSSGVLAVAVLPAGYVAAGTHGADGAIWTSAGNPEQNIPLPPTGTLSVAMGLVLDTIAANGGSVVAAGYEITSGGDTPIAMVSTDGGQTWGPVIQLPGAPGAVTALASAAAGFVAAGLGKTGQLAVTWRSPDGQHWSLASTGGPLITAFFRTGGTVKGVTSQGTVVSVRD